jgi:hypothetical protein
MESLTTIVKFAPATRQMEQLGFYRKPGPREAKKQSQQPHQGHQVKQTET